MDIWPHSKHGFARMLFRKRVSLKCQYRAGAHCHFTILVVLCIFEIIFAPSLGNETKLPFHPFARGNPGDGGSELEEGGDGRQRDQIGIRWRRSESIAAEARALARHQLLLPLQLREPDAHRVSLRLRRRHGAHLKTLASAAAATRPHGPPR